MTARIFISGPIGDPPSEFMEEQGTTLADVRKQVNGAGDFDRIAVHINSPGGSVDEGFAIYDYIRATGVPVKTIAEGRAWSIASVIFMAGAEREMAENASLVIHNPYTLAIGDSREMQKTSDLLASMEDRIARIYATAAGGTVDEYKAIMAEERVIDSDEALEMGLATAKYAALKAVAWFDQNPDKMSNETQKSKLAQLRDMISNFLNGDDPKDEAPAAEAPAAEAPAKTDETEGPDVGALQAEIDQLKAENDRLKAVEAEVESLRQAAEDAKALRTQMEAVAQKLAELEDMPVVEPKATPRTPAPATGGQAQPDPGLPAELLAQFSTWEKNITRR
jgi:ATP-dependent protease ClpP protease subunit